MSQYAWDACPEPIRNQINQFVAELRAALGANLMGVYLHGSLAMGCFNPQHSDVDLLVVTTDGMTVETQRQIGFLLLRVSGNPAPFEISFLRRDDLFPWRYPPPFDLHYGEDWREKFQRELADGTWQRWNDADATDPDLAAHITITRHRGIVLYGSPVAQAFPTAPREDYRDSIVADFYWGLERAAENPVYFILNACRVYAYVAEGRVLSKDEAGTWALSALPRECAQSVKRALDIYRGEQPRGQFSRATVKALAEWMESKIKDP